MAKNKTTFVQTNVMKTRLRMMLVPSTRVGICLVAHVCRSTSSRADLLPQSVLDRSVFEATRVSYTNNREGWEAATSVHCVRTWRVNLVSGLVGANYGMTGAVLGPKCLLPHQSGSGRRINLGQERKASPYMATLSWHGFLRYRKVSSSVVTDNQKHSMSCHLVVHRAVLE